MIIAQMLPLAAVDSQVMFLHSIELVSIIRHLSADDQEGMAAAVLVLGVGTGKNNNNNNSSSNSKSNKYDINSSNVQLYLHCHMTKNVMQPGQQLSL
jgi:hypothetical protein